MRKKKKITALATAATVVALGVPSIFLTPSVHGATSDANIQFTPNESVPDVLDPSDPTPGEIFEPAPGTEDPLDDPTMEAGPLSLDYVSSVSFGSNDILTETYTYESETLRPFIQVTDARGTAAGWSVTAQLDSFTQTDEVSEETTETLEGSTLSFTNGEVVTPGSTSTAPVSEQEVTLEAGADSADLVMSAADGSGMGQWLNRWFPTEASDSNNNVNNNVTLEVPGGSAQTGEHTATITWTLSDAPGSAPSTPDVPA